MRLLILVAVLLIGPPPATAREGVGPRQDAVSPQQLAAAIDTLGNLDFTTRMTAARTVRRAAAADAVPALVKAVASHADGYVRFRALVLLSGFNDPRTRDVMLAAITDKNDRLRTVAYGYFEHTRDPQVLPRLLDALGREESEFVRPALLRAVAAYGSDPRARDQAAALVMRGQDFFRSATIEAIGDYKGAYALEPLTTVAKLDGPLQDDAVIALGKIGDKKALPTFVELQRTAPRAVQPSIAAGICLLGVNCSSHEGFLARSLAFAIANSGFQELLRSAASGLAALAVSGHPSAAEALIVHGTPARDPARAAIALALGTIALRDTDMMLKVLREQQDPDGAIELLREAFDMLEEDFAEERFFVTVRRTYWQSSADPAARKVAEMLIRRLEF